MKALFVGDICPTDFTRESFAAGNTDILFGDTRTLFDESDFSFINLECAITDKDCAIAKFGPNLKAPVKTADVLAELGVTVAGLSNNHIFDFGREGYRDTVRALKGSKIDVTGFGADYADSRQNYIFKKGSETLCVIAVCEHEYSYALEDRMGARPFDEFETIEDIREAKKTADRVVVCYHGGKEMCHYPSPRLIRACRAMARAGADLILCQHTHCIGAYEKYGDSHILYGQGNFNFVKMNNSEAWKIELAVTYDTAENTVTFTPTRENKNSDGITVCKGAERDAVMAEFKSYSDSLADGTWRDGWHKFCVDNSKGYIDRLAKLCAESATERDNAILGHYLDCEAHNDLLRELFPTWNKTNERD